LKVDIGRPHESVRRINNYIMDADADDRLPSETMYLETIASHASLSNERHSLSGSPSRQSAWSITSGLGDRPTPRRVPTRRYAGDVVKAAIFDDIAHIVVRRALSGIL